MKENICFTVPDMLLSNRKNFVFIGEAGSGKTEVSLNLAVAMAQRTDKEVHFFDMDQTKPLFRARDSADILEQEGVIFHFQSQHLDAPTVAPGVIEHLIDENSVVLMDIGGGSYGSHMIGQFSHILNRDNTEVLYLVNPYRPWSNNRDNINDTMFRVLSTARLEKPKLIANPNLGKMTELQDVFAGYKRMNEIFPDKAAEFICVLDKFSEAVSEKIDIPIFGIRLNTLPEWYQE